ncbi:c-type cytochrome [Duganella violaceipulchra]|uniref:Cytochrome c n=1 Tax=Duganella violaceipulchra TaxID=2849652 RepID=A0AA41H8S9_9BURK|nr:cytochrome c [Duganella violaceicalia]MBV6320239.1 cytochrome c [Duganella violaceicalia]MCP2011688.1 cytochrome c553 [Duganella violaceicalia]
MKKLITALFCSAVSFSAMAGGNIDSGKALADKYSCFACHGKDFNTPIDPSYPKLAGQHKDYLEHALTAYKRGDGANGRNNAIMTGQVKPLSNQDIKDLAAYLHSLPGTLAVHR